MANRRDFLKVVGVTGAGATLGGCQRHVDELIPYVVSPEEIVPGLATWYRTTCRECPAGCGISVRTREGRAVKAEGNPLSPISHGRLCPRGQASLQGLYDPDRIPQALARDGESWTRLGWDVAEQQLAAALARHRGRTVFLTHPVGGAQEQLLADWCNAMGVEWLRYDTFSWEPIRTAHRLLFGVDAVPVHDFANADMVVTFGADFMETWVSPVDYMHGWVLAHAYNRGRRGRLVAVSSRQSLTDLNADEWLNIRPGTEHLVALAMARVLMDERGAAAGAAASVVQGVDVAQAAQQSGVSQERLRTLALDFARNGRSLAVGPGIQSTHSAATAVAAAVAILNSVAGNLGRTVRLSEQETQGGARASYRDLQNLITRMQGGQVTALLVHGPNPLFTMPERAAVQDALSRTEFVASFSPVLDETSERAHLLLPDHHTLESWGDYVPRTGVRTLIQPVMTPVFSTRQTADVLLSVAQRAGLSLPDVPAPAQAGQATTFFDYLRSYWQRVVYGQAGASESFDTWWQNALLAGFVTTPTPAPTTNATPSAAGLAQIRFDAPTFSGDGEFHLMVSPSMRFWDGRHANKPWMQELPDPVSKFTWVSWVEISTATARRMGLDTGHIVRVRTPAGEAELPAWVYPGIRDDVIAIQIGEGHTALGRYARDRGVNPVWLLQPAVDAASGALAWFQTRAGIEPTGRWVRPPQQGINDDQQDREIARAMTLIEARGADIERGLLPGTTPAAPHAEEEHETEVEHGDVHPQDASVRQLQSHGGLLPATINATPQGYPPGGDYWGENTESAPRWGMAIDLDRCTGCSACVTACYAENNIAVVGPDQVAMGRIMHWIRLERFFESNDQGELQRTHILPMLCQHCGNAPCEPVCPVYAAYHTPDGLNGQVYNRCVGTRYCANNCPYKVRVFNWFTAEWPEPLNWQLNPDVTVREKGVMEKCSFCVQRIRDAQNHARLEDRAVLDGEIVPACAQTCPADAIVFGNMADPSSRVRRIAESGRAYRVLESLNTQSAITYLKRIVPEAEA